jgi:branched-chain amino acid transport system ATP-binding protein
VDRPVAGGAPGPDRPDGRHPAAATAGRPGQAGRAGAGPAAPLLSVRGLEAGYGRSRVLHGIDLDVPHGQVVALLGRNGMGKTTTVHTIMGMLRPTAGSIRLDGVELAGRPAHAVARAGIAIVPQGRRVFAPLTVEENLRIGLRAEAGGWTLERVYQLLPRLAERARHRGDQLSGGEQQMLAIGRALLRNPRLLVLDEPSDGLAPTVVEQVTRVLAELVAGGLSAVLVEQNLWVALELAAGVCVMAKGQIVHRASAAEFRRDPGTARALLGVG